METMGIIPGTFRDVFTIGRDRPDLQRKHRLAGLGDNWRDQDGCRVVVLENGVLRSDVYLCNRRNR